MSETTAKHKIEATGKLRLAVITCSTSRYQQLKKREKVEDVSGDLIAHMLTEAGHSVSYRRIIADDPALIKESMNYILNRTDVDAAIFCGGTGVASSDITIETVSPFLEKTLLGFGEMFRRLSFDEIGSAAVMSRAIAGVAKRKAIFCIPGSPHAAKLCLEKLILPEIGHILKHARE